MLIMQIQQPAGIGWHNENTNSQRDRRTVPLTLDCVAQSLQEMGARLPGVRVTHRHGPPSCEACSQTSLGSPHALQGDSSQVESIPRIQALCL